MYIYTQVHEVVEGQRPLEVRRPEVDVEGTSGCLRTCIYIYIYIYINKHTYMNTYIYIYIERERDTATIYIYIYIYISGMSA